MKLDVGPWLLGIACFGFVAGMIALGHREPKKRAHGSSPSCLYTITGDYTVLDNETGLEWQRYHGPGNLDHPGAAAYCDGLGDGWRLATIAELLTTVDESQVSPAFDTTVFLDTTYSENIWSSTEVPGSAGATYYLLNANLGQAYTQDGIFVGYPRCVR